MMLSTPGERGKYVPALQRDECDETLKVQYNRSTVFVSFLPTEQSQISLTHLSQIMVSLRKHLKLSIGIAKSFCGRLVVRYLLFTYFY